MNTALEPRLQKRYENLVAQHLTTKQSIAAGLACLPSSASAFASTQAAWRFFQNHRLTLPALTKPLLELAQQAVSKDCRHFALVVHDLTGLDYKKHSSKDHRLNLKKGLCGYQLQSSLLISDRTGQPLTLVSQSLWIDSGIYTTRHEDLIADASALDELTQVIEESSSWQWDKQIVHIHDRGADSVAHYRQWIKRKAKFLVGADAKQSVEWQATTCNLGDIPSQLSFRYSRKVKIKGVTARQYIAETQVRLVRPAYLIVKAKG